jgi:hypothetical protein
LRYAHVTVVHAVIWTPSGGMHDLGTLSGDASSAASKINLFGAVIGSSGSTVYYWNESANKPFEVVGHPFIWTRERGMQDLNTLIPANSGWILQSVAGINLLGADSRVRHIERRDAWIPANAPTESPLIVTRAAC